jgi:hypothetical protein
MALAKEGDLVGGADRDDGVALEHHPGEGGAAVRRAAQLVVQLASADRAGPMGFTPEDGHDRVAATVASNISCMSMASGRPGWVVSAWRGPKVHLRRNWGGQERPARGAWRGMVV